MRLGGVDCHLKTGELIGAALLQQSGKFGGSGLFHLLQVEAAGALPELPFLIEALQPRWEVAFQELAVCIAIISVKSCKPCSTLPGGRRVRKLHLCKAGHSEEEQTGKGFTETHDRSDGQMS